MKNGIATMYEKTVVALKTGADESIQPYNSLSNVEK
jgi:hypothetical protein